ncbi:MAG: transcriptional regulator GcvA [Lautropia sp.]
MPSTPRHRLPPLNSLRAFEAAARHGSLRNAAVELCVTPAAVSQQIKLLESTLGLKLFLRNGGRLELTAEAIQYLPVLSEAFDAIAAATMRLTNASFAASLSVSSFTHFALAWLLPRLRSFNQANPDVNVTVVTSIRTLDFVRSGMDVAVRWGHAWPNLEACYLFSIDLIPLCAPSLLRRMRPRKPADLLRHPLLVVDGALNDWFTWLKAMKVDTSQLNPMSPFDSLTFALQAAADGHGVVMARLPLAESFLRSGQLVAPFPTRVRSEHGYYLLYPKAAAGLQKVMAFRDWIVREASATEYFVASEADRRKAVGSQTDLVLSLQADARGR